MPASPDPGFGLYVHWPFCLSKCPYCDFNSHISSAVDPEEWLAAYLAELEHFSRLTGDRLLGSIYFGGGTPSLMPPEVVGGVIDAALRHFRAVNDLEVTLEANPTSVEAGRFRAYRLAGVNRVSIGVQALNDDDLRALGRMHSVAEALAAVDLARSVFERSNFDLIYARQNQSLAGWEAELRRALDLGPDHLSLYQLTIEEGTPFFARHARGGLRGLPDEDLQADLYDLTQLLCTDAGLPAYEISNHARPGFESRHNLTYWRGGDWIGIGPGAHGRLGLGDGRVATATIPEPQAWLSEVCARGHGCATMEPLSGNDSEVEYVMMGLRVAEGIDLDRIQHLDIRREAEKLVASGHLSISGRRLCATSEGRPLLNMVLRDLLVSA